jgi:hypothetical protein
VVFTVVYLIMLNRDDAMSFEVSIFSLFSLKSGFNFIRIWLEPR